MTDVISVRFRSGCKEYYFDPKGLTIPAGTDVIVETAQGPEFAHCAAGNHQVPDDAVVKPLRSVLRIATDNDKHTAAYNRSREKEAFDVCKKKIQQHKLEMKLVRVECSFEGNKILRPHRAAADRRPRRGQDDRRPGHLRPALLLRPVHGRVPARVHQDGQDPEPESEPYQDLRYLRPADVLPEI